jgi:amicyanin
MLAAPPTATPDAGFRSMERPAAPGVGSVEEVPMMRGLLALLALQLVAVATAEAQPETGPRIEIKAHAFGTPEVTVRPGTTVTWVNHDDDVHTVTSTADVFKSPGLDTNESYSYTFATPGTYTYFCTLHPLMTGKVVVRSGS